MCGGTNSGCCAVTDNFCLSKLKTSFHTRFETGGHFVVFSELYITTDKSGFFVCKNGLDETFTVLFHVVTSRYLYLAVLHLLIRAILSFLRIRLTLTFCDIFLHFVHTLRRTFGVLLLLLSQVLVLVRILEGIAIHVLFLLLTNHRTGTIRLFVSGNHFLVVGLGTYGSFLTVAECFGFGMLGFVAVRLFFVLT